MDTVEDLIRGEIRQRGAISFARFMSMSLYSPKTGYYETHARTIGRRGDYFTSVSVGEVFGELLAHQVLDWVAQVQSDGAAEDNRLIVVEAGAHDGRLALDLLNCLAQRAPEHYARLQYRIIEPSDNRRNWQLKTLEAHKDRLLHVPDVEALAPFQGVFLSNELLDAFPVHRFCWNRAKSAWEELGVTEESGQWAWVPLECPSLNVDTAIEEAGFTFPPELLAVLPDGYVLELNPSATGWWRQLTSRLERGFALMIDYGLKADEWIHPGRLQGTARAYADHRVSDDLLATPGRQDLTAHVNFTAIERAGLAEGAKTVSLCRQSEFLTRIVQRLDKSGAGLGWNAAQLRQFQTLVHPNHLGYSFRVLVQQRGLQPVTASK